MFDQPFRARFASWARPVAPALGRLGLTPNHITVATFFLALAAATFIAWNWQWIGLAAWLVSRVGDGLDGVLARHVGHPTPFGGYLDITLDMAAYAAMVVGFASLHPELMLAWLAILAGYGTVITTTLALSDAARASGRRVTETDRTFQFTPAVTEAGETTVMYVLWVVFPTHLPWLVWVWVIALGVTCVQRTILAARVLR